MGRTKYQIEIFEPGTKVFCENVNGKWVDGTIGHVRINIHPESTTIEYSVLGRGVWTSVDDKDIRTPEGVIEELTRQHEERLLEIQSIMAEEKEKEA